MSESTSVHVQGLLDRLQRGDEAAREELLATVVRRLGAMVEKALRGFPGVGRWERTSDVVQNTLLRLNRALQGRTFASARELFGFAAMLSRRELVSLLRHYYGPQGPGTHHESQGGELGSSDHPASPAADHGRLEQWARFHEGVDDLPGEEREVFILAWYFELGQQEIARMLEVSERTVKRRWRAARLLLAERFGKGLLEERP
jgi:RNA polymerase sigma-70 factor (ECF subfamily)